LFIEKAKKKIAAAVALCFVIVILNDFVLSQALSSYILMIYAIIALITFAITRKEWREAKAEAEQ
jgi:protein-S-isoprenylcysteine O-methyltransferase Ste14